MYRIYRNILHSFPGGFKILVKSDIFRRILWLISWSLQDDQGGITCMPWPNVTWVEYFKVLSLRN